MFDGGEFEAFDTGLTSSDPLGFVDSKPYTERLRSMQESTSLSDALISGAGTLDGRRVQICAMEMRFIGGSMGCVVGEKIARAIDRSLAESSPLIIVSASGGARMQEGAVSLMQMAKISAGLMRLDEARIPFISVLTDPTTGGVTASYAMLGDLNIAEPGALIGFAGPRVIEQTIRQKLPEGFQRSEFLLKHGMLDAVVPRLEMKGSRASRNSAAATEVLASCMRERMPSCMRAPPEAVTVITARRSARARSNVRATFSPTTEPIEPPMKKKSMAAMATGRLWIVPRPVKTASLRPVVFCAWAMRSG